MRYLIILAILFLLDGGVLADSESIRACTVEESQQVHDFVKDEMVYFTGLLRDFNDNSVVYEAVVNFAREQREYWLIVDLVMPDCAEKYTWGHATGRILDEYTTAFGVFSASEIQSLRDKDLSDDLLKDGRKHIITASRIARGGLPSDIYEKYEDFFTTLEAANSE